MKKFWKWKNQAQTETAPAERTLYLNGTIAEESWFDDDVTPQLFKEELMSGDGNITVWINSPGGDCVAAAQIYNMLMDYPHDVTVKIDGIAASAASVIAMAGTKVLMSPVSMLMIHNPMTVAMGDTGEMQKAIEMLSSVKDSIINAYEIKTGLSRAKLSHLMDTETWMDAGKAVELGFADEVMKRPAESEDVEPPTVTMLYSKAYVDMGLPDPTYPRINRIILQFDANKNATDVVVKRGNTASNPLPPERSTTEAMFEIHLVEVRREPGAVSITAKDVRDLRLDKQNCGLMADSVTEVDTSAINAQITALIEQLAKDIADVKGGTAFIMRSGDKMDGPLEVPTPTEGSHAARKDYVDAKYRSATLTVSGWSGSGPYTQTVTVEGVVADKAPRITPVYSGSASEDSALKEASAAVSYAKPGNGSVTFTCLEDKPGVDIPIQVEVRP